MTAIETVAMEVDVSPPAQRPDTKLSQTPVDGGETVRSGFHTTDEPHPSKLVEGGEINKNVSIDALRKAIPDYCFKPSLFWSSFYLARDIAYSTALIFATRYLLALPTIQQSNLLYYGVLNIFAFCQGIVWTGIWVIAHDCGHSGFSTSSTLNDTVGFILHSFLLAPYFSWKSTHRRHHIYANHIDRDCNYVPPQRNEYAKRLGVALEMVDEVAQDAPVVLFLRIILQQVIGWNWYLLTNITCPPTAVIKKNMSLWRHSHFDPWGSNFRESEFFAVLMSDLGCLATIAGLAALYLHTGNFNLVLWGWIVPWCWVNHWLVMITFLHHTHPSVPKYTRDSWTFMRGATATIDRDFGFIGTHFFHHISSDHVTHHLFSRIPHYYSRVASEAIVPLLGSHYHGRGSFGWEDLRQAFGDCQWVEADAQKDVDLGLVRSATEPVDVRNQALWYRKGKSPPPEFRMRGAPVYPTADIAQTAGGTVVADVVDEKASLAKQLASSSSSPSSTAAASKCLTSARC